MQQTINFVHVEPLEVCFEPFVAQLASFERTARPNKRNDTWIIWAIFVLLLLMTLLFLFYSGGGSVPPLKPNTVYVHIRFVFD